MKILFATDGSVNADNALQSILENTWEAGTACKVVTCAEQLKKRLNAVFLGIGDLAARAQTDLEKDLHDLLIESEGKLQTKFGKENVSSEFLSGNPKVEVVEAALKYGADLIIIGAHGSNVDETWSGSVTRSVVINAPCSVQVLNTQPSSSAEKKEEKRQAVVASRYLVAISDETNADMIIDSILKRAWPQDTKFQILSIAPNSASSDHSRFFKSKNMEDLRKEALNARKGAADKLVKDAASKLQSKFGASQVTSHVLVGNPRSLILQVAQDWPADMVIMGSHEQDHGILEHFLGSTAAAVTWNANCSVELVKLAKVAARR
ncbi:MAG TPA: universal stress protein [Planktothrix sp.]|jgi:nucleotide-binding universal stress UspA family protein